VPLLLSEVCDGQLVALLHSGDVLSVDPEGQIGPNLHSNAAHGLLRLKIASLITPLPCLCPSFYCPLNGMTIEVTVAPQCHNLSDIIPYFMSNTDVAVSQ
jgi:hypothetical protein